MAFYFGYQITEKRTRNETVTADDIAISSALKDCKNGVYAISTRSEIVAAECISLLKGNHHGQPMKILEQKGEVGGNSLTGGGTTATVGWIVIFDDLPDEKPVLLK